MDSKNNIYVTGANMGSGTDFDYTTIKYNNNGSQQWAARYDGPINNTDQAVGIVIDKNDNVTVTGKSAGDADTIIDINPFPPFDTTFFIIPIFDYATIQYNKDGAVKWIQTYDGPAHKEDFATALAIDNRDNVYITGASTGIGSNLDYTTIKYSRKGKLEWTQRYNGTANGIDQPNDIAVDDNGNVYITGLSLGVATNFDIATVKYLQVDQVARSIVDFNYVLKKINGEYSCPTPKVDCSKISPGPSAIFGQLDTAIARGTIKDFFNHDERWNAIFPNFRTQTANLNMLKSGEVTLVKKTNALGEIFYIGIPPTVNPNSFDVTDTKFTIQVLSKKK